MPANPTPDRAPVCRRCGKPETDPAHGFRSGNWVPDMHPFVFGGVHIEHGSGAIIANSATSALAALLRPTDTETGA